MAAGLRPDLRVFPDLESLSRAAASGAAGVIRDTIAMRSRCDLALSGGETPRGLYRLLATEYRGQIPWHAVHLFWGDERYVSADDPRSNYGMVRRVLLDHVPVQPENVHPMTTNAADPEDAARAYETILRGHFAGALPRFDLILLGLGADGHTASLFPGSPALREHRRWVVPVAPPAAPSPRLTLTLPVLNNAARVWFLVAGADKAAPLSRALSGDTAPEACPAGGVRPTSGEVIWWADCGVLCSRWM